MDLRLVEDAKIKCAKKHFERISNDKVKFDAVSGFNELLTKLRIRIRARRWYDILNLRKMVWSFVK